ncbi:MAG: 16S rRNA pseudouridine(516) synthase RsuA [Enterovibrio sp.]
MIRLDKYLCEALDITRKQAGILLKTDEVCIEGVLCKSGAQKLSCDANVTLNGKPLHFAQQRYFMLNKPEGVVCSHDDPHYPTVFVLLDEIGAHKLHIAGRLDADTTGLVLLTDDGQWSHRITSPKRKCAKIYDVELADPVSEETAQQFAQGVQLRGEKQLTKPAKLEIISQNQVRLTIFEGKYHQVKRMFAAVGNKVISLHRHAIGELQLDPALQPGEYRPLTEAECQLFAAPLASHEIDEHN